MSVLDQLCSAILFARRLPEFTVSLYDQLLFAEEAMSEWARGDYGDVL